MSSAITLISSVNVGSGGATTIDFTSIPATYTDLNLVVSARSDVGGEESNATVSFNNSTSNRSMKALYGQASTATSFDYGTNIYIWMNGGGSTASTFGNASIYVPNYAGSNNKPLSIDGINANNSGAQNTLFLNAGLWSDSSAINRMTLTCSGGNFVQYSTAYLYGISNA
jgi:hypothetical protein